MKHSLAVAAALLAVLLSGCSTCNPESTTAKLDAQQAELPPVGDAGSEVVAISDVATSETIVVDADAEEVDAQPPIDVDAGQDGEVAVEADGETAQDSLDDVVGPAVAPTNECGEGVMSTPQPGDPCELVGATRCSDVGSKWVAVMPFKAAQAYCHQPHLLRCQVGAEGKKQWSLDICAVPESGCVNKPALATTTCQDSGGKATCALLGTAEGEFSFADKLHPCSQADELAGATGCSGSALIMKCSTILNAVAPKAYPWVQQMLDKFAPLSECCPTCRYWLPYKTCPDMNIGICWGWANPEQGVKVAPVCLENIPGQPPTCVSTCAELKYSDKYKNPP